MTHELDASCPWLERVSALLDGELPQSQTEMVSSHVQSCATCSALKNHNDTLRDAFPSARSENPRPGFVIPIRHSPQLRVLLSMVGIAIIVGSMPEFIRGNADGNSFHDLRHLAMWQAALGCGTLSAAISFRLSYLLTVVISTFLVLTTVATVYDLVTGHRGPWTDPMHLVEIAAVLGIMRLIYPRLRLMKIRRRGVPQSMQG